MNIQDIRLQAKIAAEEMQRQTIEACAQFVATVAEGEAAAGRHDRSDMCLELATGLRASAAGIGIDG